VFWNFAFASIENIAVPTPASFVSAAGSSIHSLCSAFLATSAKVEVSMAEESSDAVVISSAGGTCGRNFARSISTEAFNTQSTPAFAIESTFCATLDSYISCFGACICIKGSNVRLLCRQRYSEVLVCRCRRLADKHIGASATLAVLIKKAGLSSLQLVCASPLEHTIATARSTFISSAAIATKTKQAICVGALAFRAHRGRCVALAGIVSLAVQTNVLSRCNRLDTKADTKDESGRREHCQ